MKNQWKTIRTGFLLFALPLVVTAAASAHSWIIDSSPISIDTDIVAVENAAIGVARVHTVALNRNGAVEGRIASIDAVSKNTKGLGGLKIFFIQDGAVVKETVTGSDGSFLVSDIAEGAYSFVASGKSGFAAYGVNVVADDSGEYDNVMEAAAVSPRFDVIRQILNEELPQEVASEILENGGAAGAGQTGEQVVGSNRVLLEGGVLQGRVVPLSGSSKSVKGTNIHILQNDVQVAKVQTDASGSFVVTELEPGVYDFVAAGTSGFAAVSFEAVASDQLTDLLPAVDSEGVSELFEFGLPASGPVHYESGIAVVPGALEVRLTATQDGQAVGDQLGDGGTQPVFDDGIVYDTMPIEYASDSMAYGGVSGSMGAPTQTFRGGGYGGGGGFGRIALWGGLAVGITALATNGSSGNPPPASNATP